MKDSIVEPDKSYILFLSTSSVMCDTLSEELNERWNFHLVKPVGQTNDLDILCEPDLVIVDTYSLGLSFIDAVRGNHLTRYSPILVIDEYDKKILINKIMEGGVTDYLQIDNFNDQLKSKIEKIIYDSRLVLKEA